MGFEPRGLPDPLARGTLEPIETCLANLRKIRTDIKSAIELARQVMIHRSSRGTDKFEVGDKVWLDGRNLSLAYESRKIAPLRHGPFTVKDVIGPIMYRLVLPTTWKIHPVFTVDRLTHFRENDIHRPNYTEPPPDLVDGENEYEIEAILKHKTKG